VTRIIKELRQKKEETASKDADDNSSSITRGRERSRKSKAKLVKEGEDGETQGRAVRGVKREGSVLRGSSPARSSSSRSSPSPSHLPTLSALLQMPNSNAEALLVKVGSLLSSVMLCSVQ
jgi:hypothetical protein